MNRIIPHYPLAGWSWRSILLLFNLFLFIAMAIALPAQAAPRTPGDDAEVLEVLPTYLQKDSKDSKALERLQAQWRTRPDNMPTRLALVRAYIEHGREQSDPRYYGYAEALLQDWWTATAPPPDILLLRATLRQHNHDYPAALTDLQQLVTTTPHLTQGWLTLAVVQLVRGDYPAAKQSCAQLARHASTWYATLCFSQVMSLTGNAERGYQLQATLLAQLGHSEEQIELRQWVLTLLGENAWRLGKLAEAGQHFQAGLQEARRDNYLLRVYSDWLLAQQRPLEVLELLKDKAGDDALLLRLALASRDAGKAAETAHYRQLLEERYAAARLRGSSSHARDEALYLLEFDGDPLTALALAEANWAVQKEFEDTYLLLRAAQLSQQSAVLERVQTWLDASHQQDVRLQTLLAAASGKAS